jgi:hypothetical protein
VCACCVSLNCASHHRVDDLILVWHHALGPSATKTATLEIPSGRLWVVITL